MAELAAEAVGAARGFTSGMIPRAKLVMESRIRFRSWMAFSRSFFDGSPETGNTCNPHPGSPWFFQLDGISNFETEIYLDVAVIELNACQTISQRTYLLLLV